ncbi:MAG TPA: lipid-A-disaccharide synthase [Chthoniobacterales bacterium]
MTRLYLVAGELSGDTHGAALMRDIAIQSAAPVEFSGAGGPEMQRLAGKNFTEWTSHAVVGLWEVIKNYGYFRRQFHRMIAEIGEIKPDAVILIDYPGFNLRLAKALRGKFPQLKIIYYISPQVWAWNRGRIPKMAKWLDLMICLFPFEKELYDRSGLRTEFAGHPMLDELEKKRLAAAHYDADLVGLFPGSREREIRKILPIMLESALLLAEKYPQLRFAIPAASEKLETLIRSMAPANLSCDVQLRTSSTLMQTCTAGMIASGTATLEATFFGLPYALIYKVSPLTYEVGRRVIRVPFLGMANILAGREVIPEFIQQNARPDLIAAALEPMIFNPIRRAQLDADLKSVIATLGERGASGRAAAAVLKCLGNVPAAP